MHYFDSTSIHSLSLQHLRLLNTHFHQLNFVVTSHHSTFSSFHKINFGYQFWTVFGDQRRFSMLVKLSTCDTISPSINKQKKPKLRDYHQEGPAIVTIGNRRLRCDMRYFNCTDSQKLFSSTLMLLIKTLSFFKSNSKCTNPEDSSEGRANVRKLCERFSSCSPQMPPSQQSPLDRGFI